MSVIHIVAFNTPASTVETLTTAFLALKNECKRNEKPYIVSVKGGKQISTENLHHDMKVAFIMTFEKQEDLAYYLDEDPVHEEFKNRVRGNFECKGVVALDFVDGAYN